MPDEREDETSSGDVGSSETESESEPEQGITQFIEKPMSITAQSSSMPQRIVSFSEGDDSESDSDGNLPEVNATDSASATKLVAANNERGNVKKTNNERGNAIRNAELTELKDFKVQNGHTSTSVTEAGRVSAGVEFFGGQKMEVDSKWRRLRLEELEIFMKQIDLLHAKAKLVMNVLKSYD